MGNFGRFRGRAAGIAHAAGDRASITPVACECLPGINAMKWNLPCLLVLFYVTASGRAFGRSELHVPGQSATIQAAINAAVAGDEIIVAPGTYHEAIDFIGKAVTLRSSDGPKLTILDGTGLQTSVVQAVSKEGVGTRLQGFTITGGAGVVGSGGGRFGGGLYHQSEMIVVDCVFADNMLSSPWFSAGGAVYGGGSAMFIACSFIHNGGGAVFNGYDHPMFVDCEFRDNPEGGMANLASSPTRINCRFENNTSIAGGAVYNSTVLYTPEPQYIRCSFIGNHAAGEWGERAGGAIYNVTFAGSAAKYIDCEFIGNDADNGGAICNPGSQSKIVGCTFRGNQAYTGAAIASFANDTVIDRCVFEENIATGDGTVNTTACSLLITDSVFRGNLAGGGGGVAVNLGDAVIANSLFEGNTVTGGGGAILIGTNGKVSVLNCTMVSNVVQPEPGGWTLDGGAVLNYWQGKVNIFNCIAWGNLPDQFNNGYGNGIVVGNSDVEGGWSGSGECNIESKPGFVDAAAGDWRLRPDSPCVDAGNNDALPRWLMKMLDLIGGARIADGDGDGAANVDMGAIESPGVGRK